MRRYERYLIAIGAGVGLTSVAHAQQPPAVRQLGALERMSNASLEFSSISTALARPGGRVMVNDIRRRRVVLLDSTLTSATAVADTTSTTSYAYGSSWATLIRFRGDSALLLVPSTLSMFVLGPTGSIARVMAIPRANEAQQLSAGILGMPAIDASGRRIYFRMGGVGNGTLLLRRTTPWLQDGKPAEVARGVMARNPSWVSPTEERAESSAVVRVDLETRLLDTAAMVRGPRHKREVKVDKDGFVSAILFTPDPLPLLDQWTVLRDGTLAIVRGDYHIDWIDATGRMSSTPKMPFEWQRLDDARKIALIDSAVANWQPSSRDTTPRPGRGRGGVDYLRNTAVRGVPSDLPDYAPAFGANGVTSDWGGNVWIRTSKMVDARPVYDVVNRKGEIIDRVQLPRFRVIAGFGPGVVYMAVLDSAGKARLERARIK